MSNLSQKEEFKFPPILQVRTKPKKDDFVTVSLCVTVFCPRLVVWATSVAHKSRNDKLEMNHRRSGCLCRCVIFEVKGLKSNFHTPTIC